MFVFGKRILELDIKGWFSRNFVVVVAAADVVVVAAAAAVSMDLKETST